MPRAQPQPPAAAAAAQWLFATSREGNGAILIGQWCNINRCNMQRLFARSHEGGALGATCSGGRDDWGTGSTAAACSPLLGDEGNAMQAFWVGWGGAGKGAQCG